MTDAHDNDDPFRPPTDSEIDAAEARIGIKFHPDYRSFLKGGSDVGDSVFEPAVILPGGGYLDLFEILESAWNIEGVPRDLMPFVEDNSDYYCLNPRGEVVFWSHNGTSDEKWSSLVEWRQKVCIEETRG